MVKKTWRNKLTAFISTENRNSHASPDILVVELELCPNRGVWLRLGSLELRLPGAWTRCDAMRWCVCVCVCVCKDMGHRSGYPAEVGRQVENRPRASLSQAGRQTRRARRIFSGVNNSSCSLDGRRHGTTAQGEGICWWRYRRGYLSSTFGFCSSAKRRWQVEEGEGEASRGR